MLVDRLFRRRLRRRSYQVQRNVRDRVALLDQRLVGLNELSDLVRVQLDLLAVQCVRQVLRVLRVVHVVCVRPVVKLLLLLVQQAEVLVLVVRLQRLGVVQRASAGAIRERILRDVNRRCRQSGLLTALVRRNGRAVGRRF